MEIEMEIERVSEIFTKCKTKNHLGSSVTEVSNLIPYFSILE
jgi:hypothetical protein